MRRKFWVFIPLLLSLLWAFAIVQAQTATPATSSASLVPDDEARYRFTLEDLGYKDIALNGAFGTNGLYIPLPATWESSRDVQVHLDITSSPLLKESSNITLLANGKAVGSAVLRGSVPEQGFDFTVPAELVKGPGLALTFRGYLRVTDEICEDSNIPGQWSRILGSSRIDLSPPVTVAPDLEFVTGSMFVRDFAGKAKPILFVLPDNVDEIVLSTAVRVAAGFGHQLQQPDYVVNVVLASQVTKKMLTESNIFLFGLAKDNALIQQVASDLTTLKADNLFYTFSGEPLSDNDGLVQLLNSPWNLDNHVLVISANSPVGLSRVGEVLSDPATVRSLRGSYEFISNVVPGNPDPNKIPWVLPETTLKQLGHGSRTARGVGLGAEYYTLFRSAGWRFDSGSQFVLKGTASPAINNEASYIALILNDVPIGTFPTSDFIRDGSLTFTVPNTLDDQLFNWQVNMQVGYSNQLQQDQCDTFAGDTAWIYIDESSYFKPNMRPLALPNLQAYPFPFTSSESVNIVIEPTPQMHHIVGAVQLALNLGFYSPAGLEINLKKLDTLQADDYQSSHLIFLLGRGADSDYTQLFPAEPETAATPAPEGEEPEKFGAIINSLVPEIALYKQRSEPFGIIYTDVMPSSPTHVALVITSETKEGFQAAIDTLTGPLPPVDTASTLTIAQPERPLQVLYQPEEFRLTVPAANLIPLDTGFTGGSLNPAAQAASSATTAAPSGISLLLAIVPIIVSLLLLLIVWAFQRKGSPNL